MALTATAVPQVQADILATLGLHSEASGRLHVAKASFDRENLRVSVMAKGTGGAASAQPSAHVIPQTCHTPDVSTMSWHGVPHSSPAAFVSPAEKAATAAAVAASA